MKTEFAIKIEISSLIQKKQDIFNRIQNDKKLTSGSIEKYSKQLKTLSVKITCLVDVING